jgi:hypothetical protein
MTARGWGASSRQTHERLELIDMFCAQLHGFRSQGYAVNIAEFSTDV